MYTLSTQQCIKTINQALVVLLLEDPQPCQVCQNCAPFTFQYYGHHLADMTWCSRCYQELLCVDPPLIDYYRKHHLRDNVIMQMLPKVRWGVGHPRSYLSIDEIHALHSDLFLNYKNNY